jgi:SAM-dependent methyltransferase
MADDDMAGEVLAREYDARITEFGDTARGAHWPNEADRRARYEVMLDVIEAGASTPLKIVDLGCGSGGLLDHINATGRSGIDYLGVDASEVALSYARKKHPDAAFERFDVGAPKGGYGRLECDYLVANGLFTVRFDVPYVKMWDLLVSTVRGVWPHLRRGLAFNVMSTHVDWQRDDLFHVPIDDLAELLHDVAGRHVRFRGDYGLYEYTAFAHRQHPSPLDTPGS